MKIGHPKKRISSSNHPFSGAKVLVSGGRVDLVRTWTLRIRKIRTVTHRLRLGNWWWREFSGDCPLWRFMKQDRKKLEIVYLDLLTVVGTSKTYSAKWVGLLVISHGAIRKRSQTKQIQVYVPYRRGGIMKSRSFRRGFRSITLSFFNFLALQSVEPQKKLSLTLHEILVV